MPINNISQKEKLVEILPSEIALAPFWEDKIILTGDREIDFLLNLEGECLAEYAKEYPLKIEVRESVKEKLLLINEDLSSLGFQLIIKIGYRPIQVQKSLFDAIFAYMKNKFPDKSYNEIYQEVIQFVSDPTHSISPHTTGGAVDVLIKDEHGNEIDMGCPVNHIGEEANRTSLKISQKHHQNRDILTNVFLKHDFSCLASEWWHFSYGDPYWAKFHGKQEALYGRYES